MTTSDIWLAILNGVPTLLAIGACCWTAWARATRVSRADLVFQRFPIGTNKSSRTTVSELKQKYPRFPPGATAVECEQTLRSIPETDAYYRFIRDHCGMLSWKIPLASVGVLLVLWMLGSFAAILVAWHWVAPGEAEASEASDFSLLLVLVLPTVLTASFGIILYCVLLDRALQELKRIVRNTGLAVLENGGSGMKIWAVVNPDEDGDFRYIDGH